jgi:hypothetical protein
MPRVCNSEPVAPGKHMAGKNGKLSTENLIYLVTCFAVVRLGGSGSYRGDSLLLSEKPVRPILLARYLLRQPDSVGVVPDLPQLPEAADRASRLDTCVSYLA